jgi:hypothetical protein
MTIFKKICKLTLDLNKPELIYHLLHIVNHSAFWTSENGATLEFSQPDILANDLTAVNLKNIIPKLYRYQFDLIPRAQQSFKSIWRAIVPSKTKAVS